jgi:hypothetical protein
LPHNTTNPRDIVKQAVAGVYDIPEFQRGFVWSPEKVKNLLDSLCRDYPLGSILCWRAPEYQSARTSSSSEASRLWIVDGQQRTTALCLLLGKKPHWFPAPESWNAHFRKCDVRVNLLSDPEDVELSLVNPIIEKQSHWISVRDIVNLPEADIPAKAVGLVLAIGRSPTDTTELSRVMTILNRLHAAMRREVVVIEIAHDPVDVAEIFSRLNSAGTRVNEGDIALALIAVRQEGWVREKLLPYLDHLGERGFLFDPSFVIRAMVAVRRGTARLKDVPREFWEANPEFAEGWEKTKKAINNVVRVLRELGVLSADILPARNALIPLFALDDLYAQGDADKLRQAFLWLLRAIRDGRYSSSAITTIAQDLTAIRNAGNFEKALAALTTTLAAELRFTSADVLLRYDENPFLLLILYLVAFERKAEDWKTGQRLGFDRSDNSLNDGFRPEWHHFVPRGRLKNREPAPPTEELINCLANIVVLGEGDNRRFSYSEPHKYLAKYNVPDDRVYQQCFPEREMWTAERFEDFVRARSALLADAMNDYCDRLAAGRLSL